MKYIRHGDINLHKVSKIEGEIIKHNGSYVVAEGETTGHKHVLKVKDKEDLIIKKDSKGNFYFELLSDGEISHEEHKTLVIPKGIYKEVREREVDHFKGLTRQVVD